MSECQICNENLFAKNKTDYSTVCGHVFHEDCLRNWMRTRETPNCPNCRKPINNTTIHRIFVDIADDPSGNQLLAAQISSLSDLMKNRDKKADEAMNQMKQALEKMSVSMKAFEAQNERLRTENEQLKTNSVVQKGMNAQLDSKTVVNANYKEVLKAKLKDAEQQTDDTPMTSSNPTIAALFKKIDQWNSQECSRRNTEGLERILREFAFDLRTNRFILADLKRRELLNAFRRRFQT